MMKLIYHEYDHEYVYDLIIYDHVIYDDHDHVIYDDHDHVIYDDHVIYLHLKTMNPFLIP